MDWHIVVQSLPWLLKVFEGMDFDFVLWDLVPWLTGVIATISLMRKGYYKTGLYAIALIAIFPHFAAVAASLVSYYEKRGKGKPEEHSGLHTLKLPDLEELDLYSTEYLTGSAIKDRINELGKTEFMAFRKYKVKPSERRSGDVSRGSGRIRDILTNIQISGYNGYIVELGAGRGGWTQVIAENCTWSKYICASLWNQPGQEERFVHHNGINFVPTDARMITPAHADLLLSDMGENPQDFAEEVARTQGLLNLLKPWMTRKPTNFIIRIPTVFDKDILDQLERWQKDLGTGHLIRLEDERNSVTTTYFVPGSGNIREEAFAVAALINRRLDEFDEDDDYYASASDLTMDPDSHKQAFWPPLGKIPVPDLPEMDMTSNIPKDLRKPVDHTEFLKEIGWVPSSKTGTQGTGYNPFVYEAIKHITGQLAGFGLWQTTSTTPEATYATVLKKVDKAPKEDHEHYGRLWAVYRAMSDYIKKKGGKMRRLDDIEMAASINKDGAMGDADSKLGFINIGDYFKHPDIWKPRVEQFKKALLGGKPIWATYNSIGKKERKQSNSSRLIWYMCATARLFEARIFGHYDSLLKKLPYSVSGIPLYDYGEILAKVMKGKHAVCDDVAGWDTKVSYSMQCLECEFLCSLTDDKELRNEIRAMYRLYAHPMVWITRIFKGHAQEVLFKLRGQVASGRRVTYGMNTTTNIAVTASRASYSQDIPEDKVYEWMTKILEQGGHTEEFGGKISGDDSAIVMSRENVEKYATKGAYFMNDIGMPRKNIPQHMPSTIISSMEDIDFCSHRYTKVTFKSDRGDHSRWMPVRSATEILAKASISVKHFKSKEERVAWARAQALNLMVNYFHIATVRIAAWIILSGTPNNIDLESSQRGWKYRVTPWIQQGNVIDIVNGCLFGESTTVPCDFRIKDMKELGYMSRFERSSYESGLGSKKFLEWKYSSGRLAQRLRDMGEPDWRYDDWVPDKFKEDSVLAKPISLV